MTRQPLSPSVVLAEVTRSGVVESAHHGRAVAVTGSGRVVAALGDPHGRVFLRSSAKPFQALPALTEGAADRFWYSDCEVALACGSHEGEERHVRTAALMLEKADLSPGSLACGVQPPLSEAVAAALEREGEQPSVLHTECSGEHAAMAALGRHLGLPPHGYAAADSAVQQKVRETVARFAGMPADDLTEGVDGCTIPTFAVPLHRAAWMYARLVAPPEAWPRALRDACARVVRAMTHHPEMVDGTADDLLDSALMQAFDGRLVSKMGAEGVWCAAAAPSERWPDGLGVAVKIDDGDLDERARPAVALALLDRLGVAAPGRLDALREPLLPAITTNTGQPAGTVRAAAAVAHLTVHDAVPVLALHG